MQGPRETWYTEEGHLISTLIVACFFCFPPSDLGLPYINPAMLTWESLSNCTKKYNDTNTGNNIIIIKLCLPAGKKLQITYIQCTVSFNHDSAPRTCIKNIKKLQQAFGSTCAICLELNYTEGSIREMNHRT